MTRIAARAALLPLALALSLPLVARANMDVAQTSQQKTNAAKTMKAYQKQQKRQAKKTEKEQRKAQKKLLKLRKTSH